MRARGVWCGVDGIGPGVRTMSTSFLRSGRVGPAELSVREVRRGRSITTMVAELAQDQQILSVSRLTLMTERSGLEWSEPRPVDLPPPADCVPFAPPAHVVSFGRFELRFDPERIRSPATAPTWPGTCARSRRARSTRRGW